MKPIYVKSASLPPPDPHVEISGALEPFDSITLFTEQSNYKARLDYAVNTVRVMHLINGHAGSKETIPALATRGAPRILMYRKAVLALRPARNCSGIILPSKEGTGGR